MATPTETRQPPDGAQREAVEVAARVREALDGPDRAAIDPEALGAALRVAGAALRAQLLDDRAISRERAADIAELLIELTELAQDLREASVSRRFDALGRIHEALARLRAKESPGELIDAAPAELCGCCDFDRAVISRVRGSTWVLNSIHVTDDAEGEVNRQLAEYLPGREIALSTSLLETELIRRKAPALITDPQNDPRTYGPLMAVSATRGYVAAPVMPTGRVIGFLHADTFVSGRPLSTVDRDNIWTFAEGFGLIFERAVLLERLDEQRRKIRQTFESATAFIDELWGSEVRLARREPEVMTVARTAKEVFATPRESRINALLTQREREVLELLVGGATNNEIADQLVISEGTVKSHVKHILRKLRASNRAEAVSRYLNLRLREGRR